MGAIIRIERNKRVHKGTQIEEEELAWKKKDWRDGSGCVLEETPCVCACESVREALDLGAGDGLGYLATLGLDGHLVAVEQPLLPIVCHGNRTHHLAGLLPALVCVGKSVLSILGKTVALLVGPHVLVLARDRDIEVHGLVHCLIERGLCLHLHLTLALNLTLTLRFSFNLDLGLLLVHVDDITCILGSILFVLDDQLGLAGPWTLDLLVTLVSLVCWLALACLRGLLVLGHLQAGLVVVGQSSLGLGEILLACVCVQGLEVGMHFLLNLLEVQVGVGREGLAAMLVAVQRERGGLRGHLGAILDVLGSQKELALGVGQRLEILLARRLVCRVLGCQLQPPLVALLIRQCPPRLGNLLLLGPK
eukprot:m.41138 g.41138  ORF g.41138 m.41138 type:complete len:363 (+) comp10455_c0_seq1:957-2045(+)